MVDSLSEFIKMAESIAKELQDVAINEREKLNDEGKAIFDEEMKKADFSSSIKEMEELNKKIKDISNYTK